MFYLNLKDYWDEKVYDSQFVNRYVNQAWHTDVHYLELFIEEDYSKQYLIGFVD